ncbi:UNVERIFIED_CONTAM: hypothetical protein FKN15_047895 [Acipenser sinensis]
MRHPGVKGKPLDFMERKLEALHQKNSATGKHAVVSDKCLRIQPFRHHLR